MRADDFESREVGQLNRASAQRSVVQQAHTTVVRRCRCIVGSRTSALDVGETRRRAGDQIWTGRVVVPRFGQCSDAQLTLDDGLLYVGRLVADRLRVEQTDTDDIEEPLT